MEQQILAGLVARGIPEHIAKGMVANMIAESGLNPGVNERNPVVPGSRGGYGLNQWTGPRRKQFEEFAAARGASPSDLQTQLDFTVWELQNTEKGAWNAISAAPDAVTAARLYSDKFLRPGVPHLDRRLAEASRLSGVPVGQDMPQGGYPMPQQNALAQQQQAPEPQAVQLNPADFMVRNRLAAPPIQYTRFQNNLARLG